MKIEVAKLDLKPGGTLLYSMKTPAGTVMWGKSVYRKIVPPEGMEFVASFWNEAAMVERNPMNATWPLEVENTLRLSQEAGGRTKLVLFGRPINATEEELSQEVAGQPILTLPLPSL